MKTEFNPMSGRPLHYLIGYDGDPPGQDGVATVVPLDCDVVPKLGLGVGYCNLRVEAGEPKEFAPYLPHDDLWREYPEGRPDPNGPGFIRNIGGQLDRRRAHGFAFVELDNPDSFPIAAVIGAIDLAAARGLKVIAKNPGLCGGALRYVKHPNVAGMIVERGAGDPDAMDALRCQAGKPLLPVWFTAHQADDGRAWSASIKPAAARIGSMGVTLSTARAEYGNAVDVVWPIVRIK